MESPDTRWNNISKKGIDSIFGNDGTLIVNDCKDLRDIFPETWENVSHQLGSGTYSIVYQSTIENIAIKRGNQSIEKSTIMNNEAIILAALSDLDLPYFPKFYGYFLCSSENREEHYPYLVMERYQGKSYTNTIKEISLDIEDRRSILFQISHALYEAGRILQFNHNDLIGQNIIIDIDEMKRKSEDLVEIIINRERFIYPRKGLHVKLVDFGFSRITVTNKNNRRSTAIYNHIMSEKYYQGKDVPYFPSVDLCKVYGNPNLIKDIELYGLFQDCQYNQRRLVIPPFPTISHLEVLFSEIFEKYRKLFFLPIGKAKQKMESPKKLWITGRPVIELPFSKKQCQLRKSDATSKNYYLPVSRTEELYYKPTSTNTGYCGTFYFFEPESPYHLNLGKPLTVVNKVDAFIQLAELPLDIIYNNDEKALFEFVKNMKITYEDIRPNYQDSAALFRDLYFEYHRNEKEKICELLGQSIDICDPYEDRFGNYLFLKLSYIFSGHNFNDDIPLNRRKEFHQFFNEIMLNELALNDYIEFKVISFPPAEYVRYYIKPPPEVEKDIQSGRSIYDVNENKFTKIQIINRLYQHIIGNKYIGSLFGGYDALDQIICNLAKKKGYDTIIIQKEPGSVKANTEILDVRSRSDSYDSLCHFSINGQDDQYGEGPMAELGRKSRYPSIWFPDMGMVSLRQREI